MDKTTTIILIVGIGALIVYYLYQQSQNSAALASEVSTISTPVANVTSTLGNVGSSLSDILSGISDATAGW